MCSGPSCNPHGPIIFLSDSPREAISIAILAKPIRSPAHVKKSIMIIPDYYRHRRRKPKPASTSCSHYPKPAASGGGVGGSSQAMASSSTPAAVREMQKDLEVQANALNKIQKGTRSSQSQTLAAAYEPYLLWLPLLLPFADIAKNHQVRKQYTIQVGENELVLKARTPRSFLASQLSSFCWFHRCECLIRVAAVAACRSWSWSAMGPTCTSSSDLCWSSRTSRRPRPTSRSALSTSRRSCESAFSLPTLWFHSFSSQCLRVVVLSLWDWLFCRKRMDRALKDLEEKQNSKKESVCYCPLSLL